MSDIDYDELDRAVSSLSDKPAQTANVPALAEPVTDTVSVTTAPPAVNTAPTAPKPTSGRFMDVVHPSSDMRPTVVPPRPISQEAITIQPPVSAAPPMPTPTTTE